MHGKLIAALGAATLGAGAVAAGGIDRTGQDVTLIFKEGNYAEVSVVRTFPDVTGSDSLQGPPFNVDTGTSYSNVADAYTGAGFGLNYRFNEKFSLALIGAEDFGSDILYGGNPATSLLGGTAANANTYSLTLMGRWRFNENVSAHGGVRADQADGNITLNGLAYGGNTLVGRTGTILTANQIAAATGGRRNSNAVSGYNVDLDNDIGFGYAIGAAYEIPEYALRLAITYNSRIEHDFDTTESFSTVIGEQVFADGTTNVDTPQSVNVDFQSGVAEDTLLFGAIRWVDWSEFKIAPPEFNAATGTGLVSLDDSTTYELGIGRRITERFAASAAVIYDDVSGDDLVSPLAPTKGYTAVRLGGSYRVENVEFSGGVQYSWLGDAKPETGTPDTERADFSDNTAYSIGLRVGVYF